jgi:hypothetical protein
VNEPVIFLVPAVFSVRSWNCTSRLSIERFLSVLSPLFTKQGDQIAIHRARSTKAVLDRAFCEQEAQAILFLSFPLSHYRVAWLVPTAAHERARGACHFPVRGEFATARCASKGSNQATPLRLGELTPSVEQRSLLLALEP